MHASESTKHGLDRTELPSAAENGQILPAPGSGKWLRRLRTLAAMAAIAALVAISIVAVQVWPGASGPSRAVTELDPTLLDPHDSLQAEAVKLAAQLVQDFPEDPEAFFIRGLIINKFVSRDVAAQCWQACVERDPAFGEAYYWLGKDWFKKGDYGQAITHFRKAVELNVPLVDARIQLADAQISAGRPDDAVAVLEQQVRTAPRLVAGWFYLGHAYTLLGKLDEAEAAYRRAIELNPGCHQAWHGLTQISQKRGESDKAREYLKEFQKWQAKAFAGHQAGRRSGDDEDSLQRTLATAYTDAGRLYASRGKVPIGEACWVRAGEVDANHVDSRLRLLELYGQQQRPQAALPVLEQLCRIQPDNPNHSRNRDALRGMLGQDGK